MAGVQALHFEILNLYCLLEDRCSTFCMCYLFQVIIEGTAGLSYTGDIAVDDISFSSNVTCSTGMKLLYPEMFGGMFSSLPKLWRRSLEIKLLFTTLTILYTYCFFAIQCPRRLSKNLRIQPVV